MGLIRRPSGRESDRVAARAAPPPERSEASTGRGAALRAEQGSIARPEVGAAQAARPAARPRSGTGKPRSRHLPGGLAQGPAEGSAGGALSLTLILERKALNEQVAAEPSREDLQDRIRRYGRAKFHSQAVAKWALENRDDQEKRASEQASCAGWLVFRQAIEGNDRRQRLHAAKFCQQFHTCQFCAIRKGGKALSVLLPRLLYVMESAPHLVAYFVTGTVRNTVSLAEGLGDVFAGLRALMNQRRVSARRPNLSRAMGAVVGGIGHIETKRGARSGLWHPHYHGIWLCDPSRAPGRRYAIDYQSLIAAWEAATGSPGIRGKLLRSEDTRRDFGVHSAEFREQVIKDLCETLKYSVKFEGTQQAADYWAAADVLRGKRLLRGFGVLRGVKVPEDLADERLDWEQIAYCDRFFRYVGAAMYREDKRNHNMPPVLE